MVVVVNLFVLKLVVLVFVIARDVVLDALGQTVAVKGLGDILVLCDGCEEALVDSLAGICLLHDAQNTIVQVFVELLCVGKRD